MKMIAHQAIGMNLPLGLATSFSERGEEALAVMDVAKDVLTPITSIHDMINSSWVFDAQRSRHGAETVRKGRKLSSEYKRQELTLPGGAFRLRARLSTLELQYHV